MALLFPRTVACRLIGAAVFAAALAAGPARAQDSVPAPTLERGEVEAMLAALSEAPGHGMAEFAPGDLRAGLTSGDAAVRSRAEEALTARTLAYARAQHQGRVAPSGVDADWHEAPAAYDPGPEFRAALASGGLEVWLDALPPPDPRYAALVRAYRDYGALTAEGWPPLPDGPSLRLDDAGPGVAALRARLAAEGFACAGEDTDPALFGPALDCAVRAYQDRRGLEPDGVVGPQTRAALNAPAERRLAQIAASLERWRWAPRAWPATRIEVNTGAAEATLYQDGAPALTMRVIVGKASTPTPTFSASVQGVVINPPWNVPSSIARNEILPKAARDPGYLARNHYVRTGGRLVQTPGDHNALGRIKLDMPNPYTVYLHDTSAPTLFAQARRYLSHGCMRMEKPREMAAALLAGQGWTRAALDAAIAAGETMTEPLDAPVPVYVYHHTASVRDDGALVLYPDVYGWDAALIAALEGGGGVLAAPAGETECALID